MVKSTIQIGGEMRSISGDIRVSTPDSIIDAGGGVQIRIQLGIVRIR